MLFRFSTLIAKSIATGIFNIIVVFLDADSIRTGLWYFMLNENLYKLPLCEYEVSIKYSLSLIFSYKTLTISIEPIGSWLG